MNDPVYGCLGLLYRQASRTVLEILTIFGRVRRAHL